MSWFSASLLCVPLLHIVHDRKCFDAHIENITKSSDRYIRLRSVVNNFTLDKLSFLWLLWRLLHYCWCYRFKLYSASWGWATHNSVSVTVHTALCLSHSFSDVRNMYSSNSATKALWADSIAFESLLKSHGAGPGHAHLPAYYWIKLQNPVLKSYA